MSKPPMIDQRSFYPVPKGMSFIKKQEYLINQIPNKSTREKAQNKFLAWIESEEKRKASKKARRLAKKDKIQSGLKAEVADLQRKLEKAEKLTLQTKAALEKSERFAKKFKEYPKYKKGMKSEDFYRTREWRNLRWKILEKSRGCCEVCGKGKKHVVLLHVDHIKPRSKFPELELDSSNMQILCEECNIGKGAKIQTF